VTATPSQIVIAASFLDPASTYVDEVHLRLLDPASFAALAPWQRLSAPDDVASIAPRVAVYDGFAITVWEELAGTADTGFPWEARCLSLDGPAPTP
jgi:hypothetical protein